MQWPRNRNIPAVIVIVMLAIAIAVAGVTLRPSRSVSDEPLPGVTSDAVSAADVSLYLLITAGSTTYAPR